jgi:hypothetical protein
MNNVVEVINKNIKNIIQKIMVTYKDWCEWLPYTLHAYQVAIRTSTRLHLIH